MFGPAPGTRCAAFVVERSGCPEGRAGCALQPRFPVTQPPAGEEGVDARSALHSLGCAACWFVTGVLVVEAESASRMVMQVRDVPAPLSQRAASLRISASAVAVATGWSTASHHTDWCARK